METKPDFIYVHVGINDLVDGISPERIVNNYADFLRFRDKSLPNTRVIFSLPIRTYAGILWESIEEVHKQTIRLVEKVRRSQSSPKDRLTFWIRNANFNWKDGSRVMHLMGADGVHPSRSGQRELSLNVQHVIHSITRTLQGKPPRDQSLRDLPRSPVSRRHLRS